MKKIRQIFTNKPVYSGLSIFEICKIVLYEFLCGYVKPKYGEKVKLCYMDTDSFMVYIQIEEEYIYSDIVKDVEIRFGTSNYELDRPLFKVRW